MKSSLAFFLSLALMAGMLSLSSCKKEKVTSLAGTRWGTKSSLEYKYVLEFPSERDFRFEKL